VLHPNELLHSLHLYYEPTSVLHHQIQKMPHLLPPAPKLFVYRRAAASKAMN
jgi:hypothetical protein